MKDELIALLLRLIGLLLEENNEVAAPPLARRLLPLLCNERIPEEKRATIIQIIFDETFPEADVLG